MPLFAESTLLFFKAWGTHNNPLQKIHAKEYPAEGRRNTTLQHVLPHPTQPTPSLEARRRTIETKSSEGRVLQKHTTSWIFRLRIAEPPPPTHFL